MLEVEVEVLVVEFTNGEGNPCRDGSGLGVSMSVWWPGRLPRAPACVTEAPTAYFRDVVDNSVLAARIVRGSSVKSIVDSSWTSIRYFGAPPFGLLGSVSSFLALPGVTPAAITTTNKSESNRGWSVL